MKNWDELAEEIHTWARINFGENHAWQLLLGMMEETGEFLSSRDDKDREGMIDSLGDQAIYALNLCKTVEVWFPSYPLENTVWHPSVDNLMKAMSIASHGILKNSQNIRGMSKTELQSRIMAFLNSWMTWASRQTTMFALPCLLGITNNVWEQVSKRDWKKNPLSGASEK